MNYYVTREDCRLCKGQLTVVLELPATPPANAYLVAKPAEGTSPTTFPLTVMECHDCGHAQLREVVDPKLLFTNYKYASGTSASFRKHFEDLSLEIWQRQPRVLEIGSNDGTLLRALGAKYITAVGIDPSTELAESGSLTTVTGFFDAATLKKAEAMAGGPFDLLVANNVFAHIDDLKGVFELAHKAHIGTVVFEVQYVEDLLNNGAFDLIYHEHLDYHGVGPLVASLPAWGYCVDRVDHISTHGGSIRVWASRRDSRDMSNLLHREGRRAARDPVPGPWYALARSMLSCKQQLTAALGEYKRVACYGAPAKLTTLAAVLLEDIHNIAYVVDDSPWKQHLWTPNGRWEIRPATALTTDPPDAVLVSAWNFFDEIHTKLRASGFKGAIIRPFPDVKLYL